MTRFLGVMVVVCAVGPAHALAQAQAQTPSSQPRVGEIRFAYFSPQRAFSESPDGRAAQTRLTTLQAEKTKAIEEKNKALQAKQQTLEQSGTILNQQARTERTKELDKFKIDVQRFIEDAQAELTGVQRDMESAFLTKLKPALEQVVKQKSLQLVFNADEGTLAWADPALDITSDVVKQIGSAQSPRNP
jgi:Skp family chaperone for outer membrane proteins